MDALFDIFLKELDVYIWIASASSLTDAQAKIDELAWRSPAEYMVFSHTTQARIHIKPKSEYRAGVMAAPFNGC
jgi:hypothetical protein